MTTPVAQTTPATIPTLPPTQTAPDQSAPSQSAPLLTPSVPLETPPAPITVPPVTAPPVTVPPLTVPPLTGQPTINLSPETVAPPVLVTSAPIYVAYPPNDYKLAQNHVIFQGSVLPGATLTINGRPIQVGQDGLFGEWLPLTPGLNSLHLETALNGARSSLDFRVTSTLQAASSPAVTRVSPAADLTYYGLPALAADRAVPVSFRAAAGGRGVFYVGARGPFAMTASGALYSGRYTLRAGQALSGAPIRVVYTPPGGRSTSVTAGGQLTLAPGPRVAEVITPEADLGLGVNPYDNGWGAPGEDSLLYPRTGTRFTVVGQRGGLLLTRLDGPATDSGQGALLELQARTARLLPIGTPPPQARAGTLSEGGDASHAALSLTLGARIPFVITQTGTGLELRLSDTQGDPAALNAQMAALPAPDPLISSVVWSREGVGGPLLATISLNTARQWGYDATYAPATYAPATSTPASSGSGVTLTLRMRRPPAAPTDPALPLAGRTILIDPGHGGSEWGGAGPLRAPEKNLTLPMAELVVNGLRSLGANAQISRTADVKVGLYDRDLLAERLNADLLLSIHANALPDGSDPRGRRGTGVYYTQPQALPLAHDLENAVVAALPELGLDGAATGGTHLADLALTRPSTQVSALIETAFLTDPGNLRVLMSGEGRERVARAIVQGILDFYQGK